MTGKSVKDRLLSSGYVLADVAEKMGIIPQTLNSLLRANDIKTGVLDNIAKAINKNVYFFFDSNAAGEEEKSEEKSGISFGGGIEDKLLAIIQEKDGVIRQQAEEIGRLRERVLQLERGKGKIVADAPTSGAADAG